MTQWNCILLKNEMGTWQIAQGLADVHIDQQQLTASLHLSSASQTDHYIAGTVDQSSIEAMLTPMADPALPELALFGGLAVDISAAGHHKTIFLTDGSTIIAMAQGAG
jgi:hypothetical protein